MDNISIGRMAELCQTTVQTLRHYDRIGLLKPEYVDEYSGYRYYSIGQCARLDMIMYMKYLGISLDTIKERLDSDNIDIVSGLLQQQADLIDSKLKQLHHMKKAVQLSIKNYNTVLNAQPNGQIDIQRIAERKMFVYNGKLDIYSHTLDVFEYILRELRKHASVRHLPMAYFCNVGSLIRQEALLRQSFVSTDLFVFVDNDFPDSEGIETIPEGEYACTYCSDFFSERDYAAKLRDYIMENGYEIAGDYICEVIADMQIIPQQQRKMFMRLQIPIRRA
ncbi:MerR family transcriptional regulator [Paenibacillus spongiae]|uniref:MerR family transcriptional regulator n=1 Tax=Paenibacillus spongiae TaxID=2909671 RepID=A0ABY5S778_9BACL|nr:MerR family transcriptional regulator [Paenibacillus spongiae]UVI29762.1 MerR family transcriptional regulator [Paenibacillus spongiae]